MTGGFGGAGLPLSSGFSRHGGHATKPWTPLCGKGFVMAISLGQRLLSHFYDPAQVIGRNRRQSRCLICGFEGRFLSFGNPPRRNALCPRCGAKERQRLIKHWANGMDRDPFAGKTVLHVAPDPAERLLLETAARVETLDLARANVDIRADLRATGLAGDAYDIVLCNHVLEHIEDDRAAMAEIHRVLAPGGLALLMVPICEAREESYENAAISDGHGRHQHFGQKDHVRVYGSDYRHRLMDAGFAIERYMAPPADCIAFGLAFGEPLFIARKQ